MKTYTYSGETPAEALMKARNAFGDEVMIIQTKEIRKKTLNQPALYELVVGLPDSAQEPNQTSDQNSSQSQQKEQDTLPANSIQRRLEAIAEKEIAQKKRQRSLNQIFDDDVTIQLSDTVREISKIAGYPTSMPDFSDMDLNSTKKAKSDESIELSAPVDSPKPRVPKAYAQTEPIELSQEEPQKPDPKKSKTTKPLSQETQKPPKIPESNSFALSDDSKNIKDIQDEIKKLNDRIKLIQNTLWEEKSPKNIGVEIPKEFAEIYRIAKTSGMNKNHLEEIMRLSLEFMPLKMREQSQTIRRYFREVLRKMIYCRKENNIGKKIMMLVGPTGVGKTTTLAKLAARYSQILPQKKKVGIITLDDYRIGAMEQLAWYARKMRISIDSVSETDDFINKIEALSYCDYILIDTAGHSQHDCQKINELKKFIHNDDFKVDVTLVLSASTKYEDLKDAYIAFGELNIDTFIFSKLDEARGLGNIFSLVYETKKPISYLSIGQEVPSDVIVADNTYLADCLISGFFYPNKPQN